MPLELAAAIERYVHGNAASRDLHARAQASMPGGNTRTALHFDPFPLYVARSSGAHIVDVDGHRYLDVLGEYTAGLYGHSDPLVCGATLEVLARGVANGAPGRAEVDFADLLCRRFPGIESVRFCNSGTEANLYALLLARNATGRTRIIVFRGGYHGGSFAFPTGGGPMNIPFEWTICRYNDAASFDAIGEDVAAVVVEPMLTNSGCIPATAEFLLGLRHRCTATGALLLFDEVVTSRMSEGGMQKRLAITPDLTTLGKYMGAGFSFGAFGGRRDILALMNPSGQAKLAHAGTFNNNAFSMAVGFVALDRLFTAERSEQLFADGEVLRTRLNACAEQAQASLQFTGAGSIMNIHFTRRSIAAPEDLAGESQDLMRLFHFDMLSAGIYCARRGQINLSLPMTEDDFDGIVQAVEGFLHERAHLIRDLAV